MKWFQWNPADFLSGMTLGEMLDKMPASPIQEMPKIITLLENPSSPIYLPGPAMIDVHDILHCLVLRGLRAQDEAFVIGFTMGAAQDANAADRIAFKNLAGALYPKPFHFSEADLRVFDVGFDLGLQCTTRNLHLLKADDFRQLTWVEAVDAASISPANLLAALRAEIRLQLDTKTSVRLIGTIAELQKIVDVSEGEGSKSNPEF